MAGKRSRSYNLDDVEFVHKNYVNMTASEIAEERGISKFQVSKIVTELRKHHVPLAKKTAKRQNPVLAYVEKLGLSPVAEEKGKTGKGRKG